MATLVRGRKLLATASKAFSRYCIFILKKYTITLNLLAQSGEEHGGDEGAGAEAGRCGGGRRKFQEGRGAVEAAKARAGLVAAHRAYLRRAYVCACRPADGGPLVLGPRVQLDGLCQAALHPRERA